MSYDEEKLLGHHNESFFVTREERIYKMNFEHLSKLCEPFPASLILASAFCFVIHVFVQCARKREVLDKKTLLYRLGVNFAIMSLVIWVWKLTFDALIDGLRMSVAMLICSIALSVLALTVAIGGLVDWFNNQNKE